MNGNCSVSGIYWYIYCCIYHWILRLGSTVNLKSLLTINTAHIIGYNNNNIKLYILNLHKKLYTWRKLYLSWSDISKDMNYKKSGHLSFA